MRAPLVTLVTLAAVVVVALAVTSRAPAPGGAPLDNVAESERPSAPAAAPTASKVDLVAAPRLPAEPAGRSGTAAPEAPDAGAAAPAEPRAAAMGPEPSAWAAYDPRAERNARYRVESIQRSLATLRAAETPVKQRVACAIWIETMAIFTELDERRESEYVPDDGLAHSMPRREGHHSIACGGAHYLFAEGRFPLYETLLPLEYASPGAPELTDWTRSCPYEAELRARHDEALARLAAYR